MTWPRTKLGESYMHQYSKLNDLGVFSLGKTQRGGMMKFKR